MKLPTEYLGTEVILNPVHVTAEAIRAFAEAVDDLNPLYLDAEVARQAGYPNVIAPPTFCVRMCSGRMVPEVPLGPDQVSLNAGQELELYDDICAGQTYTAVARISEMYEKTGRSGPLGVIVHEVTIKNAAGTTVVVMREREIVRSPEKKLG